MAGALVAARLGSQSAPSPAGPGDAQAFSAERFAVHARTLASDAFGGRGPGTDGEERAVSYLREQLTAMGLTPEFQTVRAVGNTTDLARSTLSADSAQAKVSLTLGERALLGTATGREEVEIVDGALVFVGYGIHAPELGWDDYAGIDVRGKTVVILIGEPASFAKGQPTLASRAGYKFDEAARQGANAALLVHDASAAGFGWQEVAGRWRGQQFDLVPEDDPQPRLALRGWLREDAAEELLDAAKASLGKLRKAAGKRGFQAVPLTGAVLQAHLVSRAFVVASKNVIARLDGTRFPDEAIVYSAHWDHLGTHPGERGDTIYNGAVDNATGVAFLLEIAARFAAAPRLERSVLFLFPTLEEEGLLGSKYYANHPLVPLAKTVADFTFDTVVPIGPARDFAAVGLGRSELDAVVEPFVKRQRRKLVGEEATQADHFFRSDHLSFARGGVPVLFLRGGVHSARTGVGGEDAGVAAWNAFGYRYHRPNDEFDPAWDLRGIVPDLEVAYGVGRELASSRAWPNYRAGTLFRTLRDATNGVRHP